MKEHSARGRFQSLRSTGRKCEELGSGSCRTYPSSLEPLGGRTHVGPSPSAMSRTMTAAGWSIMPKKWESDMWGLLSRVREARPVVRGGRGAVTEHGAGIPEETSHTSNQMKDDKYPHDGLPPR